MTKVFITGATGQVGSHLAYILSSKKMLNISDPKDILCLVRRGRGSWEEKTRFLRSLGVTIVEGTLSNVGVINDAFEHNPDIEYVFHTAAKISPAATYRELYKPNVIGTRNMLKAFAKSPNGKSFIHCSSISVYNTFMTKERVTVVDETQPLGSLTEGEPYAITKRKCELMIQDFVKKYPEKSFVITRIGVVMGARDRQALPSLVTFLSMPFIPKLIAQGRDYFAIAAPFDVARGQIFLASKGLEVTGEVFNLANEPPTYREIYNIISDYYGVVPPQINIPLFAYNMFKPLFPWVREYAKNNAFIQTALSPSSVEFIGKSFIYKTDKIKNLGFKFMMSSKDTILSGLRESYPTKFLGDPMEKTDDAKGTMRSLLELDQTMTLIEMKSAEQDLECKRNESKDTTSSDDEIICEDVKEATPAQIRRAQQEVRRAKSLENRAKFRAEKIRKTEELVIRKAKTEYEFAIQIAKAEMNKKISEAESIYKRKSLVSKSKIHKAFYLYKTANGTRKKAEDKLDAYLDPKSNHRIKKLFKRSHNNKK